MSFVVAGQTVGGQFTSIIIIIIMCSDDNNAARSHRVFVLSQPNHVSFVCAIFSLFSVARLKMQDLEYVWVTRKSSSL